LDTNVIIGLAAIFVAIISGGVVLSYLLMPRREANVRALMSSSRGGLATPGEERQRLQRDATGAEYERIKSATKSKVQSSKAQPTLEERFFHAGMFSDGEKRDFQRMRILAPVILAPALSLALSSLGLQFIVLGLVMGALVGLQLPFSILDRRVKARSEDILFYLPLVIEQIAIGVSSSLDIGPCLQRVVSMADERDSHNCVTELIRHAHFYVKSGVSLEDALVEVGRLSGHTELKHAFMALSQVAKHGGEITRQLQELADAVASQRETKIEAKIKKLELEATGPVGLVFLGFLVIILIGFGVQIKDVFN